MKVRTNTPLISPEPPKPHSNPQTLQIPHVPQPPKRKLKLRAFNLSIAAHVDDQLQMLYPPHIPSVRNSICGHLESELAFVQHGERRVHHDGKRILAVQRVERFVEDLAIYAQEAGSRRYLASSIFCGFEFEEVVLELRRFRVVC
jgi:hypothetical protein